MDVRVVRKLAEALEQYTQQQKQRQETPAIEVLLFSLLVAQCDTNVLLEDIKRVDDDILRNLRIISGMPCPDTS